MEDPCPCRAAGEAGSRVEQSYRCAGGLRWRGWQPAAQLAVRGTSPDRRQWAPRPAPLQPEWGGADGRLAPSQNSDTPGWRRVRCAGGRTLLLPSPRPPSPRRCCVTWCPVSRGVGRYGACVRLCLFIVMRCSAFYFRYWPLVVRHPCYFSLFSSLIGVVVVCLSSFSVHLSFTFVISSFFVCVLSFVGRHLLVVSNFTPLQFPCSVSHARCFQYFYPVFFSSDGCWPSSKGPP